MEEPRFRPILGNRRRQNAQTRFLSITRGVRQLMPFTDAWIDAGNNFHVDQRGRFLSFAVWLIVVVVVLPWVLVFWNRALGSMARREKSIYDILCILRYVYNLLGGKYYGGLNLHTKPMIMRLVMSWFRLHKNKIGLIPTSVFDVLALTRKVKRHIYMIGCQRIWRLIDGSKHELSTDYASFFFSFSSLLMTSHRVLCNTSRNDVNASIFLRLPLRFPVAFNKSMPMWMKPLSRTVDCLFWVFMASQSFNYCYTKLRTQLSRSILGMVYFETSFVPKHWHPDVFKTGISPTY